MSSPQTETQDPVVGDRAGLYLTFNLAEEIYGLEILKVQEIIGLVPVTTVPRTPHSVRGVINLRGKVIPVIGMREKFDMSGVEDTERTCIIVVQVSGSEGSVTMGVIVDEVAEVADIQASQIEPPPVFGSEVDTGFLLGMGKAEDKVVMLLNIDRVLGTEEIDQLSALASDM